MIDNTTLLQLAKGAVMYRCRFFRSPDAYSFKSLNPNLAVGSLVIVHMSGSPERPQAGSTKTARKMRLTKSGIVDDDDLEIDDKELAAEYSGPGFAIARVLGRHHDFEPLNGINYSWIVAELDEKVLYEMPNWDYSIRAKLRLGSAIRDAEAAARGIDISPLPVTQAISGGTKSGRWTHDEPNFEEVEKPEKPASEPYKTHDVLEDDVPF